MPTSLPTKKFIAYFIFKKRKLNCLYLLLMEKLKGVYHMFCRAARVKLGTYLKTENWRSSVQ